MYIHKIASYSLEKFNALQKLAMYLTLLMATYIASYVPIVIALHMH